MKKPFRQFLLGSEKENQFYVKEYFVGLNNIWGHFSSHNSKAPEQMH